MLVCFAVLLLGLILGSFANVLIWRLPQDELPWKPAFSYCPNCKNTLPFYDNIPIVSYLLLKGKCRFCKKTIPWRYPCVEAVMAMLALLVFLKLQTYPGTSPIALGGFLIFSLVLLTVSVIDFMTFTIPDSLSLGLMALMLAVAPWNPLFDNPAPLQRLLWSLLSSLSYGATFLTFALVGKKIYKKEAMGGGDIKLALGIGAALGLASLYSVVIVSSALGLLYAVVLMTRKKIKLKDPIAYGPFLSAAAFLVFVLKGKLPAFFDLRLY